MKPLPHRYNVRILGGPSGHAVLESAGVPDLRTAPPRDFDGPGDAWSPEQLLLGAVASCYLLTFRALARASKIEVVSLAIAGEGVVDRADGVMRFTDIVLRPRLTIAAGTDRARVERALEKAKRGCLVSASLVPEVRLEPEIAG
jgi:peroxiredoxin-like protein